MSTREADALRCEKMFDTFDSKSGGVSGIRQSVRRAALSPPLLPSDPPRAAR